MGLGLSQWKSPGLSAVLAVSVLLGSVTVLAGLRIVQGPDRPAVSLDVCHPVQTFNLVATVTIARSASSLPERAPCTRDAITRQPRIKINSLNFAPDPPPPKAPI
jgi:hypothetical protein